MPAMRDAAHLAVHGYATSGSIGQRGQTANSRNHESHHTDAASMTVSWLHTFVAGPGVESAPYPSRFVSSRVRTCVSACGSGLVGRPCRKRGILSCSSAAQRVSRSRGSRIITAAPAGSDLCRGRVLLHAVRRYPCGRRICCIRSLPRHHIRREIVGSAGWPPRGGRRCRKAQGVMRHRGTP